MSKRCYYEVLGVQRTVDDNGLKGAINQIKHIRICIARSFKLTGCQFAICERHGDYRGKAVIGGLAVLWTKIGAGDLVPRERTVGKTKAELAYISHLSPQPLAKGQRRTGRRL